MRSQNPFPGISWLINGRLGGCALPDSEAALNALQKAGVTLLISLTEEWKPDIAALKARDISSLYIPIKDFTPPSTSQAIKACQAISSAKTTVLHCAAGKGRTGTLLASYLVFQGLSADAAIKKTRGVNPEWIETAGQIAFIKRFSLSL